MQGRLRFDACENLASLPPDTIPVVLGPLPLMFDQSCRCTKQNGQQYAYRAIGVMIWQRTRCERKSEGERGEFASKKIRWTRIARS